ncbi:hypothetical protein HX109_04235 [Galbibacter sp. BG1]|uniref:hypothetical protein n=1 Tax=Galbibacter sp. BG1 TaxID=1170699 RepID=UPI0015BAB4E1|nr:hypothetical protein [Galbibacter sp. BG1]QLE00810.1 hypothetical protein HX109_04235 [Galbibacter sp. BG1]
MRRLLLCFFLNICGLVSMEAQDRLLSVQAKDSVGELPRYKASLGVNMKLNGYFDVFGGLQDSETFAVGSINVFGTDDSKSLNVDLYQTQIRMETSLILDSGKKVDAVVESDFWGGDGRVRLRRAFVETEHWQIGQNWNNFGDEILWPDIMEWEGPPSGIWLRTLHIKYKNTLRNPNFIYEISLEAPINDYTRYKDLEPYVEEANQYVPDLTAAMKFEKPWGHLRLSSVYRYIRYKLNQEEDGFFGYGFSFSGIYRRINSRNNLQFQFVGGKGITAYMTTISGHGYDGFPTKNNSFSATPALGGWASYEYFFHPKIHTNLVFGYTYFYTDNATRHIFFPEDEEPSIYLNGNMDHRHFYGIFNVMYDPYDRMTIGLELDYGVKKLSGEGFVNDQFIAESKSRDAMRISFGFMFYF